MEKIWQCKIGGEVGDLPAGADGPMRRAVQTAFEELTGTSVSFTFSGWGASLTEGERAVHENRAPDHAAMQTAIDSGDGTLHGALDYWHAEALRLRAENADLRNANQILRDALGAERAELAEATNELTIERKRKGSYKALVRSLEYQLSFYRGEYVKAEAAMRTLDSEREANVMLTAELAWRTDERDRYKTVLDATVITVEELRAELAACREDAERYRWRPIETAPKDGSSVLLLVEDSDYPLEDERATATIGAYGTEGGTEFDQTWNFAGWDWCQDRYVRVNGTPTHWMPLPPVEANAARKGEETK